MKCVIRLRFEWGAKFGLLFLLSGLSWAAEQVEDPVEVEELVVVGTRFVQRSVLDSPVPVDVLRREWIESSGQVELGRVIQTLVPSFNFSTSTISDGTDSVRPATLRGMGPDQVLVLVNGKRRHGSALIHVNTSVGRGNAGVDLNAIPVSAIERIEVLRDGGAAQYGSDAVSGVINVILKDGFDGSFGGLYGATYEGDGRRRDLHLNEGFRLKNGGVVYVAYERNERGRTNRAGFSGVPQYPDTVTIPLADFDSPLRESLLNQYSSDALVILSDPSREAAFDRRNFRVGDAASERHLGAINFEMPVWNGSGELYGYGTLSHATNLSGGFYRRANQLNRNPLGSIYPDGFLPLIDTFVWDASIGGGVRREFENGLRMDLSAGHGGNDFEFRVENSHNASWVNRQLHPGIVDPGIPALSFQGQTPTGADAGALGLDLSTVNLDFSSSVDRVDLAWGFEYKRERYEIMAGEPYSYLDYDGPGGAVGGIQVFPGFRPTNEVDELRHSVGIYGDTEIRVGEKLRVGPGVRYEKYSDFGDTLNGKINARFDADPQWAFRGSVSSGFRAPSMQQIYFNNVSTQFLPNPAGDLVAREVGTFRNDSAIARAIGIPALQEETSLNWSAGIVYQAGPRFSITADVYEIRVDDRIVLSGPAGAGTADLTSTVRETLTTAGVGAAQFFMNGVDTVTRGLDVVVSWDPEIGIPGELSIQLLGSLAETSVEGVNLPAGLPPSLFGPTDRSIIEDWQPKNRFVLSARYAHDRFGANVSLTRYGDYQVTEAGLSQRYDAAYLTDMEISYRVWRSGTLKLGASNVLDVTPEESRISQSRSGTLLASDGTLIVSSPGVFPYSRRAAPFGFNGGLYYAAFEYRF